MDVIQVIAPAAPTKSERSRLWKLSKSSPHERQAKYAIALDCAAATFVIL